VALRIPGKGRNAVARLDPERPERAGETVDSRDDLAVAGAHRAGVRQRHDLALAGV